MYDDIAFGKVKNVSGKKQKQLLFLNKYPGLGNATYGMSGLNINPNQFPPVVTALMTPNNISKNYNSGNNVSTSVAYGTSPTVSANSLRDTDRDKFDSEVRTNYYVRSQLENDSDWQRSMELAQKDTLTKEEQKEAKRLVKTLGQKSRDIVYRNLKDRNKGDQRLVTNYDALIDILEIKAGNYAIGAGFWDAIPGFEKYYNWCNKQNQKLMDEYNVDYGYTKEVADLMGEYYDENTLDTCKAADPNKALVGTVAGNVALLATTGAAVGAATKGVAAFSKLAPWVQSALNTGFTFAAVDGAKAADDIPSKAEWDASEQLKKENYAGLGIVYTPVDYSNWRNVGNVALAAGKGFVSGYTAGSASSLVGNVTANVLAKAGLQTSLMEFVRQLSSNTAFSTAYMGSTYLMDSNYKPTKEQMIQDFSMALLFSAINTGASTAKLSGANNKFVDDAMFQMQKEYQSTFSSSITAEQKMAAYNRIIEYNKAIRNTISQNYYPGQQKYINDVIKGTYAIDDSINAAKAKTDLELFATEAGVIKPQLFDIDAAKSGEYTEFGKNDDACNFIDGIKITDGKVGGKIPIDEFYIIRQSSIKNPNADSITLGKFEDGGINSYIAKAGKNSSYFDMGNDYSRIQKQYKFSDKEMFDYFNKPVLDDSIARNKTIRFSHNPLDYESGAIVSEWEYIKYKTGVTNANLVYRGDYWYVQ